MKNIIIVLFELFYAKGIITSTECEHILKVIRSNDVSNENIYYAIKDVVEGDINA